MKRKNQTVIISFLLVVVFISLMALVYFGQVDQEIKKLILVYGYYGIFVLALVFDSFQQPFGPEVPAIAGLFAGLNLLIVFFVCILASFIGSSFTFLFARRFLTERVKLSCSLENHGKYCRFFSKYGRLSLLVAAISPVPYVLFVWLSAAFKMLYKDFIVFGFLPRLLRIGVVLLFIKLVFL